MDRAMDESELQISNAFDQLGFPSIKPEQRQVVRGILQRDVFAVLPMLCCYVFRELRQEMFQVLGRAERRCSRTARSTQVSLLGY